MSHQLTFYMTPSDLRDALTRIAACGDFVVLHSRSPGPQPHVISVTDFEEEAGTWLFFYLTRPEYLQLVKMREVPTQGYWAIDSLRSPVVELNRSFFDGERIGEGRVYFQDTYYGETGQKVTKPIPFIKWAECTLAAVKGALTRDPLLDAYVGSEALSRTENQRSVLAKPTDRLA